MFVGEKQKGYNTKYNVKSSKNHVILRRIEPKIGEFIRGNGYKPRIFTEKMCKRVINNAAGNATKVKESADKKR